MSKTEKGAKKGKPVSPDKMSKASAKGQVELNEEDLKRVSGGVFVKGESWIKT